LSTDEADSGAARSPDLTAGNARRRVLSLDERRVLSEMGGVSHLGLSCKCMKRIKQIRVGAGLNGTVEKVYWQG